MHGSTSYRPARPFAPPRRLILGTALALALVVWLPSRTPAAVAQEPRPAAEAAATAPAAPPKSASSGRPKVSILIGAKEDPEAGTGDKAAGHATPGVVDETDGATGKRTITVTKDGRTVTVTGTPGDKEFDSFDEFVHKEPGLAAMVVAIVAVVFLTPLLAIALILAYRMRKAKMQNETMLKLAERGIVAPVEAMTAVATGTIPAHVAGGSAAPIERARELRRHAAWSDLRKGVVMGAIGLGLTFYSVFEDRSANGIGLVLLFVGIGYVVLWWFEERQLTPRGGGVPPPGAGPGSAL
jgi:hypothetical protein